jgi:hypothetical protein
MLGGDPCGKTGESLEVVSQAGSDPHEVAVGDNEPGAESAAGDPPEPIPKTQFNVHRVRKSKGLGWVRSRISLKRICPPALDIPNYVVIDIVKLSDCAYRKIENSDSDSVRISKLGVVSVLPLAGIITWRFVFRCSSKHSALVVAISHIVLMIADE